MSEAKAVSVADHLAEGCSLKATAQLANVNASVVRRLNRKLGLHAEGFHEERVRNLAVAALEADERHGYAHDKGQPMWEAEVIDPESKFVVSHVQGQRNELVIRRLLEDAARRLVNRHRLVLLTDGEASYASLFPEIFGIAYRPSRNGCRGRFPAVHYRIPRTLAHVQIVKHREGSRVVQVDIRYTHGSQRCVQQGLDRLGYTTPNTSAIEPRNDTARRMSAHLVHKSLAFSRRPETKLALGWWGLTVYNCFRPHRSLPLALPEPFAKKRLNPVPRRWLLVSLTTFGQFGNSLSLRSSRFHVRDNLISLPNVDRVLEGLIRSYTAEMNQRPAPILTLSDLDKNLLARVRSMCEWRLGHADALQKQRGGGPPMPEPKTTDEIVACLKRIRKSIKRWTAQGGRQGYLKFVNEYIV